jgi:hypothetical protein
MAAAAIAAGAGLAACQRNQPQVAALPLDTGAAQPLGEAPPPGGLPPAPPAPIATLADYHDAYAFPDRAWGMSWAFGDSPPDYGFYDDGVSPWVWIADDDSECLAEPVPGGERYYYFEPGAYTPFYVQDPSYGYGFENGQLAAIYARGGRQIAPAQDPTAAATAGRYLARGRILRQAAATQPHQAVAAANWNARRGLIASERNSFSRDAAQNPAWLAYHSQHAPQDQDRFAAEAARRENWAAQTDTRLGEASRAGREQRLSQAIAQGVGPGRPSAPAPAARSPALALNRYAAPAPTRAGPELARRGPAQAAPFARQQAAAPRAQAEHRPALAQQQRIERAPHQAFTSAEPPRAFARAPSPQPTARVASEHASDTAFQARASTAFAQRQAAAVHQAPQPHAFRAPAQSAPAFHAAPPPHVAAPPAAAHPPGPAQGPANDKKH